MTAEEKCPLCQLYPQARPSHKPTQDRKQADADDRKIDDWKLKK